jgi:hypothetical protein
MGIRWIGWLPNCGQRKWKTFHPALWGMSSSYLVSIGALVANAVCSSSILKQLEKSAGQLPLLMTLAGHP